MKKEPEEGNKAPKPIWTEGHKICKNLKEGSVSSVKLMENIYSRIESINPEVNAIVNLLPKEEALSLAKEADKMPIPNRGPLHGLPMAPKDAV
ncbi:MAG TPA: amidase family protein, partial [SAR86 cluster bacterium]|nr:amidase family protein [SAR86 cluster bacterium]